MTARTFFPLGLKKYFWGGLRQGDLDVQVHYPNLVMLFENIALC